MFFVLHFLLCCIQLVLGNYNPLVRTQHAEEGFAGYGEMPWTVQLTYHLPGSKEKHYCGGALIDKIHVLTAAHCIFHNLSPRSFNTSHLFVRIGHLDSLRGDKYNVSKMYYHRQFSNSVPYPNDIALLQLSRIVTLSDTVQPIHLPSHEMSLFNQTGVVSGWGHFSRNMTFSSSLRAANVSITSLDECIKRFINITNLDGKICARKSLSSACEGDSGGPLVLKNGTGGTWFIIGIVSGGKKHACSEDKATHSVYTDVSKYLHWIHEVLDDNPCVNHPCENGGICKRSTGKNTSYSCSCVNGYRGRNCEEENPCRKTLCGPNEVCQDRSGSAFCHCKPGFTLFESSCKRIANCSHEEFDCFDNGLQCIAKQLVCDSNEDCRNGVDENGCEDLSPALNAVRYTFMDKRGLFTKLLHEYEKRGLTYLPWYHIIIKGTMLSSSDDKNSLGKLLSTSKLPLLKKLEVKQTTTDVQCLVLDSQVASQTTKWEIHSFPDEYRALSNSGGYVWYLSTGNWFRRNDPRSSLRFVDMSIGELAIIANTKHTLDVFTCVLEEVTNSPVTHGGFNIRGEYLFLKRSSGFMKYLIDTNTTLYFSALSLNDLSVEDLDQFSVARNNYLLPKLRDLTLINLSSPPSDLPSFVSAIKGLSKINIQGLPELLLYILEKSDDVLEWREVILQYYSNEEWKVFGELKKARRLPHLVGVWDKDAKKVEQIMI